MWMGFESWAGSRQQGCSKQAAYKSDFLETGRLDYMMKMTTAEFRGYQQICEKGRRPDDGDRFATARAAAQAPRH